VSADGVWALKLSGTLIPTAAAQISDSGINDFILSVYHRSRRLVQPNETVTVKL
jgi:hypothetical protein